jgi:hypothetical protein
MGSTMYVKHNPNQKFYYMSDQTKEDVLMFKNFDSDRTVPAQCEILIMVYRMTADFVQLLHMRRSCILVCPGMRPHGRV